MTDKILSRKDGAIAHIVFNNPDKLNAISLEMWQGLGDAVEGFEADPQVRVIVLYGAGDKAFVAGADVSKYEEERMGENAAEHYAQTGEKALSALYNSKKATIAAIDGYCIGGGISVAVSCDLRIATAKSTFGQPAMRYGIGYRYKSLRRVTDLIGVAGAKDLLIGGAMFDAHEAYVKGLVGKVLPEEGFMDAVLKQAGKIAEGAPLTLEQVKFAIAQIAKRPRRARPRRSRASVPALLCERGLSRGHPRVRREAQAAVQGAVMQSPRALEGVRVLDLSRVLAAPLAAQWLADLGADVIKVERPGSGDEVAHLRSAVPEGPRRAAHRHRGVLPRVQPRQEVGHRRPLDGRRPAHHSQPGAAVRCRARELSRRRAEEVRARPRRACATLNPRLVYCSITGFGQDGPYASRPGYDGIFQAMGGMMSVSGHPEEPMKIGVSMVDVLTSLYAGIAILAALRHRDGVGRRPAHRPVAARLRARFAVAFRDELPGLRRGAAAARQRRLRRRAVAGVSLQRPQHLRRRRQRQAFRCAVQGARVHVAARRPALRHDGWAYREPCRAAAVAR